MLTTGTSLPLIGEAIGGLAIAALIATIGAWLFRGAQAPRAAPPSLDGSAIGMRAAAQKVRTLVAANTARLQTTLDETLAREPSIGAPLAGAARTSFQNLSQSVASNAASFKPTLEDALNELDTSAQTFDHLARYYKTNLDQSTGIFWASLMSMSVGFVIIIIGVVGAGANGATTIVAAVAGILSQFIAATFLVALRSTQQQATTFTQSLVQLRLRDVSERADDRAVLLGLDLLDEISKDQANPANPTKAAIAMGLIVKRPTLVEPPALTVEIPKTDDVSERRRGSTLTYDDAGPVQPR